MAQKPKSPPKPPEQGEDRPVVRLIVEGGTAEERYDFFFEVSRAGVLRSRLTNALAGRRAEERSRQINPKEVTGLVGALNAARLRSALARASAMSKPIPPCSVIGLLEINDGDNRVRSTFMAEPEQARQAGHTIPADLRKAIDAVYALAARHMGFEGAASVRP